jgi:hypothetical protein
VRGGIGRTVIKPLRSEDKVRVQLGVPLARVPADLRGRLGAPYETNNASAMFYVLEYSDMAAVTEALALTWEA